MNKRESGEQLLKYCVNREVETQALFCYIDQQVQSHSKEAKLEALALKLAVI